MAFCLRLLKAALDSKNHRLLSHIGVARLFLPQLLALPHGSIVIIADAALKLVRDLAELFCLIFIGCPVKSAELPLVAHRL